MLDFKLEPICEQNGKELKLWGYEVLLRSSIPNTILFAAKNPPLDFFVFENALDFIRKNGRRGLHYTVNIQPSTLKPFGLDVREAITRMEDLSIFIELTETGGSIPRSILSGIKVILDDFGNMESNLHRLLKYNPIGVKLEIDLIESSESKGLSWITHMIGSLKTIGKMIIGERIETKNQLLLARELGVTHYQGKFVENNLTKRE